MKTASELISLDDIEFLRELSKRYPEMEYLTGQAESSPEGNGVLKPNALAYRVFVDNTIHPTAIEADRTLLGLLTLKWVLNDNYDQFTFLQTDPDTRLTRATFDRLRAYTMRTLATDGDLEFCLDSLACNDLGKTQYLVDKHMEIVGRHAPDHDQLLDTLIRVKPSLFPSYEDVLSPDQQILYQQTLNANFNLGQYIQGENLPVHTLMIQAMAAHSRDLRLVTEIYDTAGVTGHIDARGSVTMDENTCSAFLDGIDNLMIDPKDQAYARYIHHRATKVGIDGTTDMGYAQGRLIAHSRIYTPQKAAVLSDVFDNLPAQKQDVLTEELNKTGFHSQSAIYVYYAPAFIINTAKMATYYADGLYTAFNTLADIYQDTRANAHSFDHHIISVNINRLARAALNPPSQQPRKSWQPML